MYRLTRLKLIVKRLLIVVGVVLAPLALNLLWTPATQAALDGCRSDPVMYLTDGTVLDLTADIDTSVSNVTTIAYAVHVPRGARLLLYVATPTIGFQGKESFKLVNDAPVGQYKTDTLVQTKTAGVGVTSHTTLVGAYVFYLQLSLQAEPASGFNGQHLWTTIYR